MSSIAIPEIIAPNTSVSMQAEDPAQSVDNAGSQYVSVIEVVEAELIMQPLVAARLDHVLDLRRGAPATGAVMHGDRKVVSRLPQRLLHVQEVLQVELERRIGHDIAGEIPRRRTVFE